MDTNTKTLAIVISAMISHVCNWCLVGACDAVLQCLEASIGSTAFNVGVSLLLAQYAKYPCSLQKPPRFILWIYYILLSFFVSSLSMRLIWMPLIESMGEINVVIARGLMCLNKMLACKKKSSLKKVADFFETKAALTWMTNLLGTWFLYWVAESLNILKKFMCYLMSHPIFKCLLSGTSAGKTDSSTLLRRRASGKRRGCRKCTFLDVISPEAESGDEEEFDKTWTMSQN